MKKQNLIITKENLIKTIANQKNVNIFEIKDFYNILEESIFEYLSSADNDKNICIRLFEGISLNSKFYPEKEKKSNLTGKTSLVSSRIKPKFNITRSYREKLNNK